jgi:nitrite reductase/ring-hydroxylating ferredoxin subunit
MDDYFEALSVDRLPPGTARTVEHQGHRYAVFHHVDGTFHALDDACPHRKGPLGAGYVDGFNVHCPLHGWAFDIRSGHCSTRPDRPVQAYPVRVENGHLWVGTRPRHGIR